MQSNYLSVDDPKLLSVGPETELLLKFVELFKKLKQFECPDMYSKIKNDVLILEHFGFDGSEYKKGKGLKGYEEESSAEKSYQEYKANDINCEFITSLDYAQTPSNYMMNFERVFQSHYHKIDKYKHNLFNAHICDKNSTVITGFFIENKYPPYISGKANEVELLCCKQFLDIFEKSFNLDFVLFGGIFKQAHRLFYIDKEQIINYKTYEIDLHKISFLHTTELSWANFMKC